MGVCLSGNPMLASDHIFHIGTSGVTARRVTLTLLLLVSLAVLPPLFATTIPPLHDYPFHLARMDAIAALTGEINHPTHYQLGSFLLPNVAMDVATLGLTAIVSPMVAGRVFLGVVLLTMLTGTVALHRAIHDRWSPWPLVAAFFLYNWIFLFGFMNYLFGVGIMLWSLAAWLALRRANVVIRLAAGTMLAVITLFCHLVAFGLFGVVLGGLALSDAFTYWRATRRLAIGTLLIPAVPIGITLALFVILSPTAGEVRQPFVYADWYGWKPLVAYRTLLWSIPWLNVVTIVPIVLLVAIAAWRRRFRVSKMMLAPIGFLIVTFFVMPNNLFGGQYADARLPIAILLIVLASVDLVWVPSRVFIAVAALAIVLLVVRGAAITKQWRDEAPLIAGYQAAFKLLPAGATLYVASVEPFPKIAYDSPVEFARWHPPLKHLVSLASIGKDVFVPSTWADPHQQPISVEPGGVRAKKLQGDNPFLTPTAEILAEDADKVRAIREPGTQSNDFMLLLRPESLKGLPASGLTPIAHGNSFALFRIE